MISIYLLAFTADFIGSGLRLVVTFADKIDWVGGVLHSVSISDVRHPFNHYAQQNKWKWGAFGVHPHTLFSLMAIQILHFLQIAVSQTLRFHFICFIGCRYGGQPIIWFRRWQKSAHAEMMQSSDIIMMSEKMLTNHSSLGYEIIHAMIVCTIQHSITWVLIWLASLILTKYYPFDQVIYSCVSYTLSNGNLKEMNFVQAECISLKLDKFFTTSYTECSGVTFVVISKWFKELGTVLLCNPWLLSTWGEYLFERSACVWLCFEMRSLNQLVVMAVTIITDSVNVDQGANNTGRFWVKYSVKC